MTAERRSLALLCVLAAALSVGSRAHAWGDEGHEVIALVAEHELEPQVRARVRALLAGDDSRLCTLDIAHEATWADKYRDSDRDGARHRYEATRRWHYVDIELHSGELDRSCRGRPAGMRGSPASTGPARDCIVDKIDDFRAELRDPGTEPRERLLALQFLLHLVGDLHQPLHAADDGDQGGNRDIVSAPGLGMHSLHHDWDSEFVARLGAGPEEIARRLLAGISDEQRRQWSRGSTGEWALESFSVAKRHAYGLLPAPSTRGHYELRETYVLDAIDVTAQQLSKAGVRLAFVLNQALR